jgi:hypothetical protein
MFVSVYCLNKCTIKIKSQVILLIISRVIIKDAISSVGDQLKAGVPQGSVLAENHNISLTWVKFYKPSF